jgi:hypothetical protein
MSAMALTCLELPVGAARAAGLDPRFSGPVSLRGAAGSTEPRVAVAPDGTEYVVSGPSTDSSAPSVPVKVYASHDHGRTWAATAGQPVQAQPSADVDIVVTRTGRLVVVELDSAGLNLVVSYSDDRGATWTASTGAARIADQDRPWLAVGPDDPSTHQPRVYLLFHNAFSGNATENMYVETSSDGGASFGIPVPLTAPGSAAFLDLQCGDTTGPSSLSVNPRTGRLYAFWVTRHGQLGGCGLVPQQPVTLVASTRVWGATSPDNSSGSWTDSLAVDGSARGNIVAMSLAPAALDTAGNVYVAYPESPRPFPDFTDAAVHVRWAPPDLSHWSAPITIAASGPPGNVLTHVAAGRPGQLDVAWMAAALAAGRKAPDWYLTVAHVVGALSPTPTVAVQRVQTIPAFSGTATEMMGWCDDTSPANQVVPACLMARSSDVWGVGLDASCRLLVTWGTISAKTNPTIGAAVDATWVASQSGGPSLCAAAGTVRQIRACAGGSGRIGRGRLGPVSLGMTRARVRRLFPSFTTRAHLYMDFLCPQHLGIRVGYPSSRLLAALPAAERSHIRTKAVLILTAAPRYSLQGAHPGSAFQAARQHLMLGAPYRVGTDAWYVAADGGVLNVRGGRVQEVGIADPTLTRTRSTTLRFLTSFSDPASSRRLRGRRRRR